ncbi:methyltransferase domain-containing protein [Candidatus Saccharibacteria bacterium]|nr:methyltransferase domain-containing protein [Candidatus Saccharibacteria bacterium]
MRQTKENLAYLEEIIDLDWYLEYDQNLGKGVKLYYALNKLAYRVFHSKDGFMHFRVSKNGEYNESDVMYQVDKIASLIKPGDSILELGFGQGANLFALAEDYKDVDFTGVDLFPTYKKNSHENVKLLKQNYEDLSRFSDESFDVVFAIETLVHSSHKEKIFKQVNRILKPGGYFIVYDYASVKDVNESDEYTKKALTLIAKGGASAEIESFDSWKKAFAKNGFIEESNADLSKEVLPDLKRLKHEAYRLLRRKRLAKTAFKILPKRFLGNVIVGYLGYDSCKEKLGYYMEFIYKKP